MNENEILGFDPTSLSVFNQEENKPSNGNGNIYRMRPAESTSSDGKYYATVKIIYNPFNLKQSILEQQSYGLQDADGWFSVVSSLTNNDTKCPIFTAWKKCHYATPGSDLWKQAAKVEEGGKALFDKRYARYVTIQVIRDKNHPELEGKYMFWKMPAAVWQTINSKMNPGVDSGKAPIPVMDFLFGRAVDITVIPGPDDPAHPERKTRETKYLAELTENVVSCTNPDGSPLLNDAEQNVLNIYVNAMRQIWSERDADVRAQLTAKVNADPNTLELRKIYSKVLEQIKSFCPNLVEELGYKEWSDDIKARVQKWIDCVLSGNNPADAAPIVAATVDTTPVAPTSAAPITSFDATPVDNTSDDLPF